MLRLKSALFLALASACAVQLNTLFLDRDFSTEFALLGSAIGGVAVASSSEWIVFRLPMRWRPLRRLLDARARFEGRWAVVVQDETAPLSVAHLRYSYHADEYVYSGEAFSAEGIAQATWQSNYVNIDLAAERLWYYGEGRILDEAAEVTKVFGMLDFETDGRTSPTRARGFFVDFGTKFQKRHYTLVRIDSPPFKGSEAGTNFASHADVREFILAMRREYQDTQE